MATRYGNATAIWNPIPDELPPLGPPPHVPREEFSFLELAVVLVRRKTIVLAILLMTLLATGHWLWSGPPVFESRAVLKIGRCRISSDVKPAREQQDMLLEPARVLALRLREEFRPGCALGQEHAGGGVSNVIFDKDADELLTVVAQAGTARDAQGFLTKVTDSVVQRHEAMSAPARKVMRERIEAIQERRARVEAELESLAKREAADDRSDTGLYAVQSLTRGTLLEQRQTLEKEEVQLQLDLVKLQVQPTALLTEPSLPREPLRRNAPFYLCLGAVFGLILGSAAALGLEFAAQVRQRMSAEPGMRKRTGCGPWDQTSGGAA